MENCLSKVSVHTAVLSFFVVTALRAKTTQKNFGAGNKPHPPVTVVAHKLCYIFAYENKRQKVQWHL